MLKLYIYLMKSYGFNKTSALNLCQKFGFDYNMNHLDCSTYHMEQLDDYLKSNYKNYKLIKNNINLLKRINCYKGVRHSYSLSVNGQNTKNNCKTQKNKKK